jgi:hypothetical protein
MGVAKLPSARLERTPSKCDGLTPPPGPASRSVTRIWCRMRAWSRCSAGSAPWPRPAPVPRPGRPRPGHPPRTCPKASPHGRKASPGNRPGPGTRAQAAQPLAAGSRPPLSRRVRVRAKLARQPRIRYMTNTCKSVIRAYNFGPKTGGVGVGRRHGRGRRYWGRADWA